jgi:vancomycin resistance protein YoaR
MSTVLYGALLDAGLPIAERHAHSLPVGYATQGRDATVSWGGADLKFRNSTQETLIIESGGTVRRIYAILWSEEEITQPQPKPAPAFPIETLPSS